MGIEFSFSSLMLFYTISITITQNRTQPWSSHGHRGERQKEEEVIRFLLKLITYIFFFYPLSFFLSLSLFFVSSLCISHHFSSSLNNITCVLGLANV